MHSKKNEDCARIILARILSDPSMAFFLNAISKKDAVTHTHSVNVGFLAAQVCVNTDKREKETEQVVTGALLHDVGKLFVPTPILRKKGSLTAEEFHCIKKHPTDGVMIVENMAPQFAMDIITDIIQNHHEVPDGSGYGGDSRHLSYYSQLIRALDMYDALTSERPYHAPYTDDYSLDYLSRAGVSNKIVDSLANCVVK